MKHFLMLPDASYSFRLFAHTFRLLLVSTSTLATMSFDATKYAPVVIPDESREIDASVSTLFSSAEISSLFQLFLTALTAVFSLDFLSQKCVYPPEYEGHFNSLMIDRAEIIERASALAKLIQEDYKGRRPVMLCVLKGASPVRFDTTEFVKL